MKSGLLTLLYGLEAALAAAGAGDSSLPFERLTVIANPDEEIGSPASTPHIERVARASDVAFSLECARANGDIVSSRKGTGDYVITVTAARPTPASSRRRGAARSSRRRTSWSASTGSTGAGRA